MTARSRPAPSMRLPPASTSPLVGSSNPAIRLSAVDLPQPEGPSSTKNSPSPTWKSRSFSTDSAVPKAKSTPRKVTSADMLLDRRQVVAEPSRREVVHQAVGGDAEQPEDQDCCEHVAHREP